MTYGKNRKSQIIKAVLGAAAISAIAPTAQAQVTGVWDNFTDATTKIWLTPGNWTAAGVPNAAIDSANFSANSGAAATALNVDVGAGNITVNALTLGITGSAQTTTILSSGGTLNFEGTTPAITSGGATGSTNVISAPVALKASTTLGGTNNLSISGTLTNFGGNRTFTNNLPVLTNTLTFGAINLTEAGATIGRNLQINNGGGGGVINLAGVISDGGISVPNNQFQIQGTTVAGSMITFSAANTYSGTTLIRGNAAIANDSAFGSSLLSPGSATAVLSVLDADHTISNNFQHTTSGQLTVTGTKNLTMNGWAYIANSRQITSNLTAPAALTLNGPVFIKAGSTATMNGTGNMTINGVFSDDRRTGTQTSSNVTKGGAGVMLLNNANTWSGNTTISDGIVRMGHNGALNNGGGTMSITSNAGSVGPPVVAPFAGTLDTNGFSPTVGKAVILGTAAVTTANASLINNNPSTTSTLSSGMSASIAGSGYTSLPTVSISGGGGAGASASFTGMILGTVSVNSGTGYQSIPTISVVGGGGSGGSLGTSLKVNSIPIAAAGTGYTSPPTVTISAPPTGLNFAGHIGTAVTTAVATTTLKVENTSVGAGGTGYTTATVTFSAPPAGTTATGTAIISGGAVTGITVTDPGSGYTSLPSITIGGDGTGAAASTTTMQLSGTTIATAGANYGAPPTVSITGGGGTGGALGAVDMGLTGTAVNFSGTGYTSLPTISIVGGSPTTPAVGTVTGLNLDMSQLVINPGSGFTSAPSVSVIGGGGTPGTITADYGRVVLNATANIGGAGNLVIEGPVSGAAGVNKVGAGKVTLAGVNTYTGNTVVNGGTIQFNGASAWAPSLTGPGFTDIVGSHVVYDYNNGSPDPAATVKGILTTAYGAGFATGQIRSSTATADIGLGWVDDTVGKQVSVARTYYGDADLNLTVDTVDFGLLAANFGNAGVWGTGDFNYDDFVDTVDFGLLAANFGKVQLGESVGDLLGALVPEPASISLIGLAAGGLLARRRRSI